MGPRSRPRSATSLALGAIALLGFAAAGDAAPELPSGYQLLARRALSGERSLVLAADRDGAGTLFRLGPDDQRVELSCDPLPGAWGMWLADVDRDGALEVLVALRKPARFDPVLENRLHVYALVGDRCVPLWRGSRLAGRFDQLVVTGSRLLALERIGRGRRWVARYRWTGFGYAVDRVLWRGSGELPAKLRKRFTHKETP